jgi:hypothetical protein
MYPLGSTAGRVLFMKNNTTTSSRGKLVGAEVHACERELKRRPLVRSLFLVPCFI